LTLGGTRADEREKSPFFDLERPEKLCSKKRNQWGQISCQRLTGEKKEWEKKLPRKRKKPDGTNIQEGLMSRKASPSGKRGAKKESLKVQPEGRKRGQTAKGNSRKGHGQTFGRRERGARGREKKKEYHGERRTQKKKIQFCPGQSRKGRCGERSQQFRKAETRKIRRIKGKI